MPSCGEEETLKEVNNLTMSIITTLGMGLREVDKLC